MRKRPLDNKEKVVLIRMVAFSAEKSLNYQTAVIFGYHLITIKD